MEDRPEVPSISASVVATAWLVDAALILKKNGVLVVLCLMWPITAMNKKNEPTRTKHKAWLPSVVPVPAIDALNAANIYPGASC